MGHRRKFGMLEPHQTQTVRIDRLNPESFCRSLQLSLAYGMVDPTVAACKIAILYSGHQRLQKAKG